MYNADLYSLFTECLCADYVTYECGADLFFRVEEDRLFVFFEKSDGLRDWINNLSFCALPYGEMRHPWRCHGGFLRVFKSIRGVLDEALADKKIRSVTLVGYSHGAALALLAHEYIWFNYPDLRDSLHGIGFGCPRVLYGNIPHCVRKRWAGFLRVSHRTDLITHLPPAILGFHHAGHGIRVGRPMFSGISAHRPESYRCALSGYPLTLLPSPSSERR